MTFALPQPNAVQFFQSKLRNCRPLAMLAMGLGLMLAATPLMTGTVAASEIFEDARLSDGIYLFGESPTVDQIGTTYMVAEVSEGKVIGGFYQPHSSFDCFYGEIAGNDIALTVIDSYEQSEHALAMTLESREAVATQSGAVGEWVPSGFHAVTAQSPIATDVLQTCRTHF
jgi:hypothetical protein